MEREKNKWFGTCLTCGHNAEAHPNPWCAVFDEDTDRWQDEKELTDIG